jgi:zinc protease
VIQWVNRATDVVAVRIYLLGGTRQLTLATAGIEPLLLRASNYGTAHYKDAEVERAMARTGSRVMINAGADWTAFGFVGLAGEFATSWRVLADRVGAPTLSEYGVEQARNQLLGEMRLRCAGPDERIRLLAMRSRFGQHPYAIDPWGTSFSLPQITAAQLAEYQATQIVRSRLLVVVAGNVDRALVEPLVAETLGQLPAGSYRWTPPPPVPERDPRWLMESRKLPTNYILGLFTGPPPQSREYPAFVLATSFLSGAVADAVRQERSLSYASFAPLIEQAIPVGGVYASTASPDLVMRILDDRVAALRERHISQLALDQVIGRSSFNSRTSAEMAAELARAELYLGDYRQAGTDEKRLRSVTSQELAYVTDRYLRYISFAFIGDTTKMRGHW